MAMNDLTILAIDDNRDNLTTVRAVVSDRLPGAKILIALDGRQGIELAMAEDPDVILLDIVMPEMDGYVVCRKIKQNSLLADIPVIFLTALRTDLESRIKALDMGAEGFLAKPFDEIELIAQIRAMAKIKKSNQNERQEKEQLATLVGERTRELEKELDVRKLAEQALQESEARYRRITEGLTDYQYTVTVENGRVLKTTHSPACLMVTGYSAEEFAADPHLWFNVVAADDRQMVKESFQQVLTGKNIPPLEHKIVRKDGEIRWISDNIICHRDTSGTILSYDGVVKDTTERKQQEEARARLQAQLNQAQKMEAIGVLAGGIAHDFNNILAAILGYAEMAKEEAPQDSQLASYLDKVLISGVRAKDLVQHILAFSRQSTTDRIPIKIQPLIKESLKMLRATIPTTISISESIDSQCGVVLAEPTQVHQIIMNLCSNAFHAMEETGGLLVVELNTVIIKAPRQLAHLEPGEYAELVVSDTGRGIGPDIINNIFNPYFTTKEVGKGTGMGLSIAHGIIKSYGGTITVESTPGRGSTFQVYFPVIQAEVKQPEAIEQALPGKERILFLDDEEALANIGKVMLERMGYTVTAHTHSFEALADFEHDPKKFDLVITDQTMPYMTGTDLAHRMLQIRPDLPIILCTGYSNLINEDSAKIMGIKAFALKPMTKNAIGRLTREVLEKAKPVTTAPKNWLV
jgi:PAS domain S-box-containing protein